MKTEKMIKKSVLCTLGGAVYTIALMQDLGFVEVSRMASVDLEANCMVVITFEGLERAYHENGYIHVPLGDEHGMKSTCYSLRIPDGYFCHKPESVFQFKKAHEKRNPRNYTICRFENLEGLV